MSGDVFLQGTSMLKAVCSSEDIYSRFPDFPKESEDDSLFRKEAELYLKKKMEKKAPVSIRKTLPCGTPQIWCP